MNTLAEPNSLTSRINSRFVVNSHLNHPTGRMGKERTNRMERDHKPATAYERLAAFINYRPPTESRPSNPPGASQLCAARRDERKRIAQELHDTLLEGFTSVALKLDALTNSLPPELAKTKEQLQKILENTDEYLAEARRSIWKLQSRTEEPL